MNKEEYVRNVTAFRLSLLSFGGINEVNIYKDSETDKYYLKEKSFGVYPLKDDIVTEISEENWNSFFDELFGKCKVMKYRRGYVDNIIFDGLQWKMRIEFANRRAKISEGNNMFPDNWKELIKTIQIVSKDFDE